MLSFSGFSNFARHYFRNLNWCLFLELLRCFSSPGSLRITIYSSCNTLSGGFPHSDISGSQLICQLPEAFRRLPRPSSPIIAKASTTCSYLLDPITLISNSIPYQNRSKSSLLSSPIYSDLLFTITLAVSIQSNNQNTISTLMQSNIITNSTTWIKIKLDYASTGNTD